MSAPIDQKDWQNPQAGMAGNAPILTAQVMASSSSVGPFDLSAYSTLIIWSATSITGGHNLLVQDFNTGGNLAVLTTPPDAGGNIMRQTLVPVQGKQVQFSNQSASTISLNVIATSRHFDKPAPSWDYMAVDPLATPNQAQAGTVIIGYGNGWGHAFSAFFVQGNVIKGTFNCVTREGSISLTDTGEMHATPGGSQIIEKEWIAPRSLWQMTFTVQTTGTGVISGATTYSG